MTGSGFTQLEFLEFNFADWRRVVLTSKTSCLPGIQPICESKYKYIYKYIWDISTNILILDVTWKKVITQGTAGCYGCFSHLPYCQRPEETWERPLLWKHVRQKRILTARRPQLQKTSLLNKHIKQTTTCLLNSRLQITCITSSFSNR